MPVYARIIVNLHHQRVDQLYTYALSAETAEKAAPGMMIRIPFGKRENAAGYIVDLVSETEVKDGKLDGIDVSKIREAGELLSGEAVFTAADLECARWMQRRYMAPLSACLALFVPKTGGLSEKTTEQVSLLKSAGEITSGLGAVQRAFLETLEEAGGKAPLSVLRRQVQIPRESLRSLLKKGYIALQSESEGIPPTDFVTEKSVPLPLNEHQQAAYDRIEKALSEHRFEPFLLHGITGSGKTEVYMQVIEAALKEGRQAILLVPEISLTPQLIDVFRQRFGEIVGVTHSRLTDAERARLWHLSRRGLYRIMIGPRSALFTPFQNLGVIILDEEHEASYKSEQMAPHYHAREVAMERCRQFSIPLVLGSATPSIETYYKAKQGEYTLLELPSRAVKESELPSAEVVDMRLEMATGNRSIFCEELQEKIRERLLKGEQTILFLNRKGYSTTVSCRKCGFVLKCPRCELPYTFHKDKNRLICHHCGKEVALPAVCPECGSRYLKLFGIGTQRVEEATRQLFPDANVVRMDMSTMKSRDDYEAVYRAFRDGEGDILIGTQMVTKGFDFPNVTLVGILAADMTLYDADYHGVERTFQLLTQVAGRAGRAGKPGEVVIQTYSPDHYCIVTAQKQDYQAFFESELIARQLSECPPFTHLSQVVISGKKESEVREEILELAGVMRHFASGRPIEVLGPSPASLEKINDVYRWKVLVKCAEEERLRNFTVYCCDKWASSRPSHQLMVADIDPMSIL